MTAERAFVSMLLMVAAIGLAFVGLAFSQALKLGDLAALLRRPLFGSGAASLAPATLGGLLLVTLRPHR